MGNGFAYTLLGQAEIVKLGFGEAGAAPFTEMAVGTGTATPTNSDMGLVAEVFRAPFTRTRNGSNITCSLTVPKGTVSVNTSITEFMIVNAHTNGVVLCREVRDATIIGANTGAIFEMKPFLVARVVT
jgi:hypothetical protein